MRRVRGSASLQRIILSARNTRGAVSCRRVGTSSLCKGELLHARSTQQPRKGIVSLVAARLVINSVRLLALLDELLRDRPWRRPHGRLLDGDHVFEGVRPIRVQRSTRFSKIGDGSMRAVLLGLGPR